MDYDFPKLFGKICLSLNWAITLGTHFWVKVKCDWKRLESEMTYLEKMPLKQTGARLPVKLQLQNNCTISHRGYFGPNMNCYVLFCLCGRKTLNFSTDGKVIYYSKEVSDRKPRENEA